MRSDGNKHMEITDTFNYINTEIVATVLKCVLRLVEDHIPNNTANIQYIRSFNTELQLDSQT
jgi:hypothetical protein